MVQKTKKRIEKSPSIKKERIQYKITKQFTKNTRNEEKLSIPDSFLFLLAPIVRSCFWYVLWNRKAKNINLLLQKFWLPSSTCSSLKFKHLNWWRHQFHQFFSLSLCTNYRIGNALSLSFFPCFSFFDLSRVSFFRAMLGYYFFLLKFSVSSKHGPSLSILIPNGVHFFRSLSCYNV